MIIYETNASADTRFNFLSERKRSDDPLTREKFEERDNREIGVGLEEIIGLADESIENNNVTIKKTCNYKEDNTRTCGRDLL